MSIILKYFCNINGSHTKTIIRQLESYSELLDSSIVDSNITYMQKTILIRLMEYFRKGLHVSILDNI